jgi:rRNA maturation RNase YbeY
MIKINNLVKGYCPDKKFFSTVAKIVLKGENKETKTISLAFVGKAEMKKLNKKFRQKNKPTDVLSFELNEKDLLGEIVICPEAVRGYRGKNDELLRVFIHGILHLCGYDHEKSGKEAEIMEKKESKILLKIKNF